MSRTCLTIILAAGKGLRMHSGVPKILHKIGNLSLINHVLRSVERFNRGGDIAIIVGQQAEMVREQVEEKPGIKFFTQNVPLGTANAVLAAREAIANGYDDILVLYGDTPLIRPETLADLRQSIIDGVQVAVLGFRTRSPGEYGRMIERNGQLMGIREYKDANAAERAINFCNSGVMAFNSDGFLGRLETIGNDNVAGEYYLTDIIELSRSADLNIMALEVKEEEVSGVNDRVELAKAEALWQQTQRQKLMRDGVTMMDPETVFLSHDTQIGSDSILEPNIIFGPGVTIDSGVCIKAFSHLEGTKVHSGADVGPFTRLRPGANLKEGARIGNFCEIKNATIEQGAKVNHLSYIGDANVGAKANVGAGTITCNYDGVKKYRTDIGPGSFIGSNTALVAPIKIGEGAYVASGSVITNDVPADALALARGRQVNKDGAGKRTKQT